MAVFIFDNDISFRIADALKVLVHGHEVKSLREEFPLNTPDLEWIPKVGERGWIVVSRDYNQRRRTPEKHALRQSNVRAIYVRTSGKQDHLFVDAARIIKNWPKIQTWGTKAKPGEMARLTTKDQIEILS